MFELQHATGIPLAPPNGQYRVQERGESIASECQPLVGPVSWMTRAGMAWQTMLAQKVSKKVCKLGSLLLSLIGCRPDALLRPPSWRKTEDTAGDWVKNSKRGQKGWCRFATLLQTGVA